MKRIIDSFVHRGEKMEFSITVEGENPVLLLHGGHSNCHEIFGCDALINNGFTVIIPSRAGYGNTSKSIGSSIEKAAEYYIELLNHLSIDKVPIIAVSAGGTTGIYLAAKYPERVSSLTLQSAVTMEWHSSEDNLYKISQVVFRPPLERFTWKMLSAMNNIFPKFIFKTMFSSFSTLNYGEAADKISKSDIESVRQMNNRQSSGSGFLIDLKQTGQISKSFLQDIRCPVLIMHSKYDASVPVEHAFYANEQIPDSRLCITESWGHLIWLGKEKSEVNQRVLEFLKDNR